jgi:hypothetical protein
MNIIVEPYQRLKIKPFSRKRVIMNGRYIKIQDPRLALVNAQELAIYSRNGNEQHGAWPVFEL